MSELIPRSPEEIQVYCKERQGMFGFHIEVLVPYLPYELAKEWLKDEVDGKKWQPSPCTVTAVEEEASQYMAFAWEKVSDHRGLSAGRNIEKMRAWMWLLGDDESVSTCDNEGLYAQYGAPILKAVSEKHGWPVPETDVIQRMGRGLPCRSDCEMGCGTTGRHN